jgi:hypothetical protein
MGNDTPIILHVNVANSFTRPQNISWCINSYLNGK